MFSTLPFFKYEATGNDFVLLDATSGKQKDWRALARRLCDRHFGIGGDGLLVMLPATKSAQRSPHAPAFRMRMFNPDGTEDMCGNGLRIAATFLYNCGYEKNRTFAIETLSGVRPIQAHTKAWKQLVSVSVNLGRLVLRGKSIPFAEDLPRVIDYPLDIDGRTVPVTVLSTGTPHTIIFTDKLDDIAMLGPKIMAHPFFPEQTSVSLVDASEPSRLLARTWERGGVGESLSCGTGACAILAAAHLKGLSPREAEIIYPGGQLSVRWDENDELWLSGNITPPLPRRIRHPRQGVNISPQRTQRAQRNCFLSTDYTDYTD